ncbi:hypothetical protein GQR58_001252 [Nymphon striatum]|nr:hypothetical protein GQR58_001252 [Nymphon striatum]
MHISVLTHGQKLIREFLSVSCSRNRSLTVAFLWTRAQIGGDNFRSTRARLIELSEDLQEDRRPKNLQDFWPLTVFGTRSFLAKLPMYPPLSSGLAAFSVMGPFPSESISASLLTLDLTKIEKWGKDNLAKFNQSKTTQVDISPKHIPVFPPVSMNAWRSWRSWRRRIYMMEIYRRYTVSSPVMTSTRKSRCSHTCKTFQKKVKRKGVGIGKNGRDPGGILEGKITCRKDQVSKPRRKRTVRRQKKRWKDNVEGDLKLLGGNNFIREKTKDRTVWRNIVEEANDLQGKANKNT